MRLIALLCLSWSLLAAAPLRIVSTAPGITEILFALGLGPQVVGATTYCNYPQEAQKVRRIGTWMTFNMEAILETRPDLVVVQKTEIHDDAKFKAVSLKTLNVQLDSIPRILASIKAIGAATGSQKQATELIGRIERELDVVRKRVAGRPLARAMFVVGRTPGALEGIIAVGKRSYLSDVMDVAGGRNIFEDSIVGYPKVSMEEILARNPEVIIDMGEHPDASSLSEAQRLKEVAMWRKYPSMAAAKSNRIHIVSSDLYVHPGPRVIELARVMADLFHPALKKPEPKPEPKR